MTGRDRQVVRRVLGAITAVAVAAAVVYALTDPPETIIQRVEQERGAPCVWEDGRASIGCERLARLLQETCVEQRDLCAYTVRDALRAAPPSARGEIARAVRRGLISAGIKGDITRLPKAKRAPTSRPQREASARAPGRRGTAPRQDDAPAKQPVARARVRPPTVAEASPATPARPAEPAAPAEPATPATPAVPTIPVAPTVTTPITPPVAAPVPERPALPDQAAEQARERARQALPSLP
jgi:hypothetical protein